MKKICVIFVCLCFAPLAAIAEQLIRNDDVLDIERCIQIGLSQHPSILAAKGAIGASESRVGQAESSYYPQVNASAGYNRIKSPGRSSSAGVPLDTSPYDSYSGNVNLSQLIYDFGRTPSQVDIQKLNLSSSLSDLKNTEAQVILNVKQAYYAELQARRNREVAVETVESFQKQLTQARGFYEVGLRPKFDVTKAEVDVSNAKLGVITTDNNLRIARVNLNNAMGLTVDVEYSIVDNLSFEKYPSNLEEALQKAYANRPDLQSLISRVQAAERNIDLARTGYYPVLSGSAGYAWLGESFPLEKGWNVGVALTLPIFSGFLTKYQVEEAQANLRVLKANEDALRQTILLEVKQAYLTLIEAEERIENTSVTVRQAAENLELAKGRYEVGVGNPIEVSDAQVAYSSAKVRYNLALADYRIAQAALEKAMGVGR